MENKKRKCTLYQVTPFKAWKNIKSADLILPLYATDILSRLWQQYNPRNLIINIPKTNLNITRIIKERKWSLAFDSSSKLLFILQNTKIDIRSLNDKFTTSLAEIELSNVINEERKNYYKIAICPAKYNEHQLNPDERILILATSIQSPFYVYGLDGSEICSFEIDVDFFGDKVRASNTIIDCVAEMIFLNTKYPAKIPKSSNSVENDIDQNIFELWIITFGGNLFSIIITLPAISFKTNFAFKFDHPIFSATYDYNREILLIGTYQTGANQGISLWKKVVDNGQPTLQQIDILDVDAHLPQRKASIGNPMEQLIRRCYGDGKGQDGRPIRLVTLSLEECNHLASLEWEKLCIRAIPSLKIEKCIAPSGGSSKNWNNRESLDGPFEDVCWWDQDKLVVSYGNGDVKMEKVGDQNENEHNNTIAVLPCSGISLARLSYGMMAALGCEVEWKKVNQSEIQRANPVSGSLMQSLDLKLGQWLELSFNINWHLLKFLPNLIPGWVGNSSSWSQNERKKKSRCTTHTLFLVEATTPEQLFDRKIGDGEYAEALELAEKYNLNTDRVYQFQWQNSYKSISHIGLYLDKIKDRPWVITQILECVPPTLSDAEGLLLYGQAETNKISHFSHLKDREIRGFSDLFARYLSRLDCYKRILEVCRSHKITYEPAFFCKFLRLNAFQLALHYSRAGEAKALAVLGRAIGPPMLQHWLPLLYNLPESLEPGLYLPLLPQCHFDTDGNIIVNPTIKGIELEGDIKRVDLGDLDDSSVLYEGPNEELKQFSGYPISAQTLESYLRARALAIEERTRLVDYSAQVLEYGMDNCLKGLNPLLVKFRILETLVYDCQLECDSLAQASITQTNDWLNLSTISRLSHDAILNMAVKIGAEGGGNEEGEGSNGGIKLNFRKNFTKILELLDRDRHLQSKVEARTGYKSTLLNAFLLSLGQSGHLASLRMFSEELLKDGALLLEERVFAPTSINGIKPISQDTSHPENQLFYDFASNLLIALTLCCRQDTSKKIESSLKFLEKYLDRESQSVTTDEMLKGDKISSSLATRTLSYKHFPTPSHINELRRMIRTIRDHMKSIEILHKYGLDVTVAKLKELNEDPRELREIIYKLSHKARSFPLAHSFNHWQIIYNDVLDLQKLSFGHSQASQSLPLCLESLLRYMLASSHQDLIQHGVALLKLHSKDFRGDDSSSTLKRDLRSVLVDVIGEYVNSAVDTLDVQLYWARFCVQLFKPIVVVDEVTPDASGPDDNFGAEMDFLEALAIIQEMRKDCVPLQLRLACEKDFIEMMNTFLILPSPHLYKSIGPLEKLFDLLEPRYSPHQGAVPSKSRSKCRLYNYLCSKALSSHDHRLALKYGSQMLKLYDSSHHHHDSGNVASTSALDFWSTALDLCQSIGLDKTDEDHYFDRFIAFALATCPPNRIEMVLNEKTRLEGEMVGDTKDDKPSSTYIKQNLATLVTIMNNEYRQLVVNGGDGTSLHTKCGFYESYAQERLNPGPCSRLFTELLNALSKLSSCASTVQDRTLQMTINEKIIILLLSRSHDSCYGNKIAHLNLLLFHLLQHIFKAESLEELDLRDVMTAATSNFDPSSRNILKSLIVETLVYSLSINITLKIYKTHHTPFEQMILARSVSENGELSSACAKNIPEEKKNRLKILFELLSKCYDRLIHYRNALAISSMNKDINVDQFITSGEYRADTLNGLALTSKSEVFADTLKIAQQFHVKPLEIYMNHLEFLLTDNESTNGKDNLQRIRIDLIPPMLEMCGDRDGDIINMANRIARNTLPLIAGDDYKRLSTLMTTLKFIISHRCPNLINLFNKHIARLGVVSELCPGLDYGSLFLNVEPSSTSSDDDNCYRTAMTNLKSIIAKHNGKEIEKIANLLESQTGVQVSSEESYLGEVLGGPKNLKIGPSLLYLARAEQLFWGEVGKEMDSPRNKSGLLDPESALLCLKPCFVYIPQLEPTDLKRFSEESILFNPQTPLVMSLEARLACCQTLKDFISGFGEGPQDHTYDAIMQSMDKLKCHLESLDANILMCFKTSLVKGIPAYETLYDLSRGLYEPVGNILADMIVNRVEETLLNAFLDFANEQMLEMRGDSDARPPWGDSAEPFSFKDICAKIMEEIIDTLRHQKKYLKKYRVDWDTALGNTLELAPSNENFNSFFLAEFALNEKIDLNVRIRGLEIKRQCLLDAGGDKGDDLVFSFYLTSLKLQQILLGFAHTVVEGVDANCAQVCITFSPHYKFNVSSQTIMDPEIRKDLLRFLVQSLSESSEVLRVVGDGKAFADSCYFLANLALEWINIYGSVEYDEALVNLIKMCVEATCSGQSAEEVRTKNQQCLVHLVGQMYDVGAIDALGVKDLQAFCLNTTTARGPNPRLAIWLGLSTPATDLHAYALEILQNQGKNEAASNAEIASYGASSGLNAIMRKIYYDRRGPSNDVVRLLNSDMAKLIIDKNLVPAFARICSHQDFEVLLDHLSNPRLDLDENSIRCDNKMGRTSHEETSIQSVINQLRAAGLNERATYLKNCLTSQSPAENKEPISSKLYATSLAHTEKAASMAKSASSTLLSLANRSSKLFKDVTGNKQI